MIRLYMSDRYFAFISYAKEHGEWVAKLQKDLERCLDHYARTAPQAKPPWIPDLISVRGHQLGQSLLSPGVTQEPSAASRSLAMV